MNYLAVAVIDEYNILRCAVDCVPAYICLSLARENRCMRLACSNDRCVYDIRICKPCPLAAYLRPYKESVLLSACKVSDSVL